MSNSTLYHGNCYDIIKSMADNSVDLVITDPPYKLTSLGGGGSSIKYLQKYTDGYIDDISNGFDLSLLYDIKRLMPKYNAFVFCSNYQILDLGLFARQNNYYYTLLVWNKTNSVPFSNGTWRQDAEFIMAIREQGAYFEGDAKLKSKVVRLPTEISKYGHPTEKPLELVERYMKIGSKHGDVVFDPFMGSGTTGHAAAKLGRKFIGCEIRRDYFDTAQKRINGVSGVINDLPMFNGNLTKF